MEGYGSAIGPLALSWSLDANLDLPPNVHVLFPNGGENLAVGSAVDLTWTASDDRLVTSIDILISRDRGQTVTPIALVTCPPKADAAGVAILR